MREDVILMIRDEISDALVTFSIAVEGARSEMRKLHAVVIDTFGRVVVDGETRKYLDEMQFPVTPKRKRERDWEQRCRKPKRFRK